MLTTALLPVFAANLCYVVSVHGGYVPWCFVYLDGCTTISATGRHGLGYGLFKLAMLPQAALLWWFWGQPLIDTTTRNATSRRRFFGRLGAAFLVIYVVFLGADSPVYAIMRRYGVFVFFIGTFIAMCIVSWRYWQGAAARDPHRGFGVLCLAMLVFGLAEIPLGKFGLADNQAENIIEWNFALLMQLWFLLYWWHERQNNRA
jgi:hypothetical protein